MKIASHPHTLRWVLPVLCVASMSLVGPGRVGAEDAPPAPPPGGKPPEQKPRRRRRPGEPAGGEKKEEPKQAPDFTLKDLDGKERKLSEFKDKWVVLEWTNYSCPFVKKHYANGNMQALQKKYVDKGVVWLSICSSAKGKEGYIETAEEWKKAAAERKVAATAILPDPDGTVGHLYGARTTPAMWVIDTKGRIVYSGAIDDTPSPMADPTKAKNYVAEVLDAALAGKEPTTPSTKSYG